MFREIMTIFYMFHNPLSSTLVFILIFTGPFVFIVRSFIIELILITEDKIIVEPVIGILLNILLFEILSMFIYLSFDIYAGSVTTPPFNVYII